MSHTGAKTIQNLTAIINSDCHLQINHFILISITQTQNGKSKLIYLFITQKQYAQNVH